MGPGTWGRWDLGRYSSSSTGPGSAYGIHDRNRVCASDSDRPCTPDRLNIAVPCAANTAPARALRPVYMGCPRASRLGTDPPLFKWAIMFQRARRARRTSASRDRIASRYFSLIFSSMLRLKTIIGSSSCSIRHCGHSMLVSNHFMMHLA